MRNDEKQRIECVKSERIDDYGCERGDGTVGNHAEECYEKDEPEFPITKEFEDLSLFIMRVADTGVVDA